MSLAVRKMRLISLRSASKYGRVRSSSLRALRSFVEAIRYMALVIFCVSLTLSILFLISAVLAMCLFHALPGGRDGP